MKFTLAPRLVIGEYTNTGRASLTWGPFVLACDQKQNPDLPAPSALGLMESQPPFTLEPGTNLKFATKAVGRTGSEPKPATFLTFADAGSDGGVYRIWLRAPGVTAAQNNSLLADGEESRSRQGNQRGSINDGDFDSFAVTYDGKPAKEDWFAVALAAPVSVQRVVFAHGKNFHDGGWFDASAGKPRIQVKAAADAPWQTVVELRNYPATTASDPAGLKGGERFACELASPIPVLAIRVIGKTSSGDNPRRGFSSCAELQAFAQH